MGVRTHSVEERGGWSVRGLPPGSRIAAGNAVGEGGWVLLGLR